MVNNYVVDFVEDALRYATDNYRKPASPLLADAYHKVTKKHFRHDYGRYWECNDMVYSNLAHQMNFMRVLNALYILEGKEDYQKVFEDNYNYYIKHYQSENGLFHWGGHRMVDLKSLEPDGEMNHELKNDYPAYPSLLKIDRNKTLKYIEAFWNAHVYNWATLETSRHGDYELKIGKLWDNEFADPEPFIEVDGLSFINTGSDLIFAACEYYKVTGEEKALQWAERLNYMYFKARDKKTGLGVYQFNQPRATQFTDDFSITESWFGDRAKRQLGPELGETCLEGNMILEGKARTLYGSATLVLLHEAQSLGDSNKVGKIFLDHCRSGLEAFARHAYIPESNMFRPLLADGRDLTGFELQRDGYYGQKGSTLNQYHADGLFLLVFAKTAAMTGSRLLWQTASQIAKSLGLGDISKDSLNLDYKIQSACPYCLFAFLNLHLFTKDRAYLDMADVIAKNISSGKSDGKDSSTLYQSRFEKSEYIWINSLEPLAVVCCEAAKLGKLNEVDSSIYV